MYDSGKLGHGTGAVNTNPATINASLLVQFFMLISVCTMVFFSYSFMGPFLEAHFSLNKQQLGLLAAAATSGNLIFSFAAGALADKFNFHKVMYIGTGLTCGALLVFPLSTGYYMILVLTFVLGVAYSIILQLTNKQVANLFPKGRRAFAMGLKQSGGPLGIAAGSVLLPLVAIQAGWSLAYLVMFALVLVVAVMVGRLTGTIVDGGKERVHRTKPNTQVETTTASTSVSGGGPNSLGLVMASNIFIGMSFAMSQVIIITFLVSIYREQIGVSLITATTLLGLVQLAGALARPGVGWLADCFSTRQRYVLGILGLCNAAMLLILGLLRHNPGWPLLGVLSVLLGVTVMGWFGPVYSQMIDVMGAKQAGKASGLVATFNLLGMTLAAPFFGYLYEKSGGFQFPLCFFAAVILVATLLFLFVPVSRCETN